MAYEFLVKLLLLERNTNPSWIFTFPSAYILGAFEKIVISKFMGW